MMGELESLDQHLAKARLARRPLPPTPADTLYRWYWRKVLPDRHGQLFQQLARGTMNSCLIRFEDGRCYVTSRNALRRG
jgi:hypothetical protein